MITSHQLRKTPIDHKVNYLHGRFPKTSIFVLKLTEIYASDIPATIEQWALSI